jgi:hypothetical protein
MKTVQQPCAEPDSLKSMPVAGRFVRAGLEILWFRTAWAALYTVCQTMVNTLLDVLHQILGVVVGSP